MFVISREAHQLVVIGNQCVVRVEEIRRSGCRISVIVPPGISVERGNWLPQLTASPSDMIPDDQNHPLKKDHPALSGTAIEFFVQVGESIHICDASVRFTLMDIVPTRKVRLAFEAPCALSIHRKEVFEMLQRELRLPETGYEL